MAGGLIRMAQVKRWPLSWILAALSVATLPAAWYSWNVERLSARNLQQMNQRETVMAPLESKVTSSLTRWEAAQANAASLQEKVKAVGETPDQWSYRSITIDNQRMSRVELEQYLRDLTTDDRNLFVPSTVNVRAAKTTESVFVSHQGLDNSDALIVTIKADLYTRGVE